MKAGSLAEGPELLALFLLFLLFLLDDSPETHGETGLKVEFIFAEC